MKKILLLIFMPATATLTTLTALIALATLAQCSVFDMRDPELPLDGVVTEDPLNINHILSIATESATNMDYRDYLTNDVEFEYSHFRFLRGRGAVVDMLNRLRTRATVVVWDIEDSNRRFIAAGNMWIAEGVPYTVYSGGLPICAGLADFRIVRELDWRISYWKDMPNHGETPFFEP